MVTLHYCKLLTNYIYNPLRTSTVVSDNFMQETRSEFNLLAGELDHYGNKVNQLPKDWMVYCWIVYWTNITQGGLRCTLSPKFILLKDAYCFSTILIQLLVNASRVAK